MMRITRENTQDLECLKKLVLFSQLDLDNLREGDLLNVKEDLYELVGRGRGDKHKQDFLQQLTARELVKIQESFRHSFEALAEGHKSVVWKLDRSLKLTFALRADNVDEPFDYEIGTADPIHTMSLSLVFLVTRSGVTPERFRKCPECDSIFLLLRKPDQRHFYCSQRCAGKAATRNSKKAKGGSTTRKLSSGGGRKSSKAQESASNARSAEQQFRKPQRLITLTD